MSIAAMDQELRRINSVTLEVLEAVTGCLSALPAPGECIVKEEWDTVVFQFDTAEMKHLHAASSLSRVVGISPQVFSGIMPRLPNCTSSRAR